MMDLYFPIWFPNYHPLDRPHQRFTTSLKTANLITQAVQTLR